MARRRAHSRQRNLTRNQKIGLGVAAGVVAAGTITAIAMWPRKPKAVGPTNGGPQGGGGPDPMRGVFLRMCFNPDKVSVDEQRVLVDNVFAPLWDELIGTYELDAQGRDEAIDLVASTALERNCHYTYGAPTAKVRAFIRDLAGRVWEEGSGQGLGGDGGGGGAVVGIDFLLLAQARNVLCGLTPSNLNAEQQRVLLKYVVGPLWDELIGTSELAGNALTNAEKQVAAAVVQDLCENSTPQRQAAAELLAHSAWLARSGWSGQ